MCRGLPIRLVVAMDEKGKKGGERDIFRVHDVNRRVCCVDIPREVHKL